MLSFDGFLDGTLRTILRLEVMSGERSAHMNLEIDTGSQPELIISKAWADHLGLELRKGRVLGLADGTTTIASSAWVEIVWLDGPVRVETAVLTDREDMPIFAAPDRRRHGGQVDGLLGRQLLARGARLEIDYPARSAKVLKSEPLAGGT